MAKGASSTGWETMLEGLNQSGFAIVGTWPMRTERGARSVSLGTNALASSIVLVCRPRPEDAPLTSRREFSAALQRELPAALHEMQTGNIAPVDLAQASIGPGMAVYSRYSKVLEPDGSRLTVRAALQLINRVLDEYLAEQEGALDEASRFAVAWFEQFGFKEGEFGTADVLARAKNTSVDALAHAGLLRSGAGKVQLLTWRDLDDGLRPGRSPHGLGGDAPAGRARSTRRARRVPRRCWRRCPPSSPPTRGSSPIGSMRSASARAGPSPRATTTAWWCRGVPARSRRGGCGSRCSRGGCRESESGRMQNQRIKNRE